MRSSERIKLFAAMILLVLLPIHSFAVVPPRQLEDSVRQAMQSSEYDWRLPVAATPAPQGVPWLVRVTDRLIDGLKAIARAIGRGIKAVFKWLRKIVGVLPQPNEGALPRSGLHWTLYVLIALVASLAGWIAWRRKWFQKASPAPTATALQAIRLDDAGLTADRLPEDGWLELAARSVQEGNFRFALRAYYLANLAWLGHGQFLTIHPGKTNREYESELRRRARVFVEARNLFAANIAAFESAWYGQHEVTAEGIAQFRERTDQVKAALATPQGAAA